jgi:hypothetical protein
MTFGLSAWLAWEGDSLPPPHSGVFSSNDRATITDRRDAFASPSEANDEFNKHLQQATGHLEFRPCFDAGGRRTGERAVVLLSPPQVPAATWRIVWTHHSEKFSEVFWIESVSLADARYLEGEPQGLGWKKCGARASGPPQTTGRAEGTP